MQAILGDTHEEFWIKKFEPGAAIMQTLTETVIIAVFHRELGYHVLGVKYRVVFILEK